MAREPTEAHAWQLLQKWEHCQTHFLEPCAPAASQSTHTTKANIAPKTILPCPDQKLFSASTPSHSQPSLAHIP